MSRKIVFITAILVAIVLFWLWPLSKTTTTTNVSTIAPTSSYMLNYTRIIETWNGSTLVSKMEGWFVMAIGDENFTFSQYVEHDFVKGWIKRITYITVAINGSIYNFRFIDDKSYCCRYRSWDQVMKGMAYTVYEMYKRGEINANATRKGEILVIEGIKKLGNTTMHFRYEYKGDIVVSAYQETVFKNIKTIQKATLINQMPYDKRLYQELLQMVRGISCKNCNSC